MAWVGQVSKEGFQPGFLQFYRHNLRAAKGRGAPPEGRGSEARGVGSGPPPAARGQTEGPRAQGRRACFSWAGAQSGASWEARSPGGRCRLPSDPPRGGNPRGPAPQAAPFSNGAGLQRNSPGVPPVCQKTTVSWPGIRPSRIHARRAAAAFAV